MSELSFMLKVWHVFRQSKLLALENFISTEYSYCTQISKQYVDLTRTCWRSFALIAWLPAAPSCRSHATLGCRMRCLTGRPRARLYDRSDGNLANFKQVSDFSLNRLVSLTCELSSIFCCSRLLISGHHRSLYRHTWRFWLSFPSFSLPISFFIVSAPCHFLEDRYVCDVTVPYPSFQFWT
jgi:hypothetical protein